jgi:hypothetical protein
MFFSSSFLAEQLKSNFALDQRSGIGLRTAFALIALTIGGIDGLKAQGDAPSAEFTTLSDGIENLSSLVSEGSKPALEKIKTSTVLLSAKWGNADTPMPDDYRSSLVYDARLLDLAKQASTEKESAILQYVLEDLSLKNTRKHGALGATSLPIVNVSVTVNSYSTGSVVSGYPSG